MALPEPLSLPPSRLARWLRAARTGAFVSAGAALGLWLGDVAVLAPERAPVGAARWMVGLGAALLVALTTALVAGALLGPVAAPVVADLAAGFRVLRGRLRDADRSSQHGLAARALALAALVPLGAVAADRVAFAVVMDFARPESMALVLAVTHLAFVAVLLLAWGSAVRVAGAMVQRSAAVPGLRWLTDRAVRLAGLLGLAAVTLVAALAAARWRELRLLPWHRALPLPGAAAGLATAVWIIRSGSPTVRRAALGALLVALGAGVVAGARLRPEAGAARRIAFDRALSGLVGEAAWRAALDVDRDGQLGVLGGGDCAPLDPRRYTGAVDVPGDGIDQDCDGVDVPSQPIRPRARVRMAPGALPPRPSVVLITVDGLAARRLAVIGDGAAVMPHVDELARDSALFVSCFSEGPSTRLSFPSMFTSRWDSQLTYSFASRPPYPMAPEEKQLQDLLDAAGYETIAVVPHPYFTPDSWPSVTRGFQRVDTSAVSVGKNNARQVTDAALRALAGPRDRPLYLWVHYYDAHAPYVPPHGVPVADRSEATAYDAELRFIDQELSRLLVAVAARPEPTYVFVTADHGTVFHPRPWTRHGHYGYDLYSPTLHVPLIVHGPGVAPRRVEGLASTMDIPPTIADLVGLDGSPDFHGNSLVPEVLGTTDDPNRVTFHEFYLGERDYRGEDPLQFVSLRTSRWNLILDRARGVYELYDWTQDYYEEHDLFEDEARSPKILRLRGLLGAFLQQFHRRPPGAAVLPPPRETP